MHQRAAVMLLCLAGTGTAQELEPALERAHELVREHRYQEVLQVLAPFTELEDPEERYIVAAELGRAHFHLGDYPAADRVLREAVSLRPQRVETALYLQATSYLVGNLDQAYLIFRELVASGATDLYLAVTLAGEGQFLADPEVWAILDELARPLAVDVDSGSVLGVAIGQPRSEVERRLAAPAAPDDSALTAFAGPHLIWAFGFDDTGSLAHIVLHNEHLTRYTPYRIRSVGDLDWRATPEVATRTLGAPASTASNGDAVVVMVWNRTAVRLTLEFAPPRAPAPPGVDADGPLLRVLRVDALSPAADGGDPG